MKIKIYFSYEECGNDMRSYDAFVRITCPSLPLCNFIQRRLVSKDLGLVVDNDKVNVTGIIMISHNVIKGLQNLWEEAIHLNVLSLIDLYNLNHETEMSLYKEITVKDI